MVPVMRQSLEMVLMVTFVTNLTGENECKFIELKSFRLFLSIVKTKHRKLFENTIKSVNVVSQSQWLLRSLSFSAVHRKLAVSSSHFIK